jgi:hypothetical protein
VPAASIALSLALLFGGDLSTDAHRFVQDFYQWYVPVLLGSHPEPGLALAVSAKPGVFTDELSRALKDDAAAQKGADEIVSVSGSFDPFTNSQDACEHYEAGHVAVDGSRYLVDVHAVCDGKRTAAPVVVVELVRQNLGWRIADVQLVRSPDSGTLLALLKWWSSERARDRSRP